jgi:hypothetical protein
MELVHQTDFLVVDRHFIEEEEINHNLVELQEKLHACPQERGSDPTWIVLDGEAVS